MYQTQNHNLYSVPPLPSVLVYNLAVEQMTLEEFFTLMTTYVRLHRDIFGAYAGELMPEPTGSTLDGNHLRGSFADFMRSNGMAKLLTTFDRMFYSPGYG